MEREGWFHKLEPIQLSSVITAKLDTRRDSIRELNEMCRSIHLLSHVDRSKLDAAVEYAQAKTASQIRKVAEHLDQFDFAPGVHTPEEYGRYMIRDSGHFNYDSNLDEFYDYGKYGRQHLPPALVAAMRGTIHDSEQHIASLLFKLAVEMDMVMNIMAADRGLTAEDLRTLRGRCVQEVRETHGRISFQDALSYQKGGRKKE